MQQVHAKRNISEIMRSVRSKGTAPELAFRKALRTKRLRYKIAPSNLAGKPDLVLPYHRIAIFIDGDFWHGGQWSKRNLPALEDQFCSTPSREYWLNKIRRNIFRDCAATDFLISQGWTVLRFWESDVLKDVESCIETCLGAIEKKANPEPLWLVPSKTFAEFFAGIGLMRMGLERQGWSSKFANDNDPQKLEMYRAQFGDTHRCFSLDDIQRMPAECVPSVTMATASFPCNDLSLAGARDGLGGKQSSTFWSFVRILEEMGGRKPPIVLLENVTGFLTSRGGQDFKDALIALNGLGYFTDAFILDAVSFVPQSRQRLFVVGVLADTPHPGDGTDSLRLSRTGVRPKMLMDFIIAHPEIRWRVRDVPSPLRCQKKVEDILEDLPHDAPEWWSLERVEYLLNQMSDRHRKIADAMTTGRRYSYGTVFRRIRNGRSMGELRVDGFAGCVCTPRGGRATTHRVSRISKSRHPEPPSIKKNYETVVSTRESDSSRIISFKV